MKKRNISRVMSVLLALMISLSLCVQLVQTNRVAAASAEGGLGVFTLRLEKNSEYYHCTAFLLYDDVTESQYILADPIVAKFAQEGFSLTLFAKGSSFKAECLGDDGYFAYLTAEGMQNYQTFLLSKNDSEQIYVFVQQMDEKGQAATGEAFFYYELTKWTEDEGVYISNEICLI